MIFKRGDKGTGVENIQKALGMKIPKYGYFGELTEKYVKDFQIKKGLKPDGIVGSITLQALGLSRIEATLSTDLKNITGKNGMLEVKEALLPLTDYFSAKNSVLYIFGHHTAGGDNPYSVVKDWANDKRGRIATKYVIGGKSIKANPKEDFDGVVVQTMPKGSWAYHLGAIGSSALHLNSVGIELCNYGYLTKGGYTSKGKWIAKEPNTFYTYVGSVVPLEQVCDLGFKFRGFQYYHKYSDKQLKEFSLLLKQEMLNNGIKHNQGLLQWVKEATTQNEIIKAFDYKDNAFYGKVFGVLSHTNVRRDKSDMSPQPNLIQMLKDLYNFFN